MKRLKSLIILCLVAALLSQGAMAAGIGPRIQACRMPVPPVIDGNVDEAAWEQAPRAADFVTALGERATVQTEAMIGYDAENIYVAFVASDPDSESVGAVAEKGTDIWRAKDDAVAFFLKPADSQVYYQFASNPRGVGYHKEHHGRGSRYCSALRLLVVLQSQPAARCVSQRRSRIGMSVGTPTFPVLEISSMRRVAAPGTALESTRTASS